MKLAWITDPHFDFLPAGGVKSFGESIRAQNPELNGVVVSGDIGTCATFGGYLSEFAKGVRAPVWFVLGNHDGYGGSLADAERIARSLTDALWLPSHGPVQLTEATTLLGVDGWYDARLGAIHTTHIMLRDFVSVREMRGRTIAEWGQAARTIAQIHADRARALLSRVATPNVLFATHMPPFLPSCRYLGLFADDNWLPWLANSVLGDLLLDHVKAHAQTTFSVLCGHTHSRTKYQAAPNLQVLTGKVTYGTPIVERVFDVP